MNHGGHLTDENTKARTRHSCLPGYSWPHAVSQEGEASEAQGAPWVFLWPCPSCTWQERRAPELVLSCTLFCPQVERSRGPRRGELDFVKLAHLWLSLRPRASGSASLGFGHLLGCHEGDMCMRTLAQSLAHCLGNANLLCFPKYQAQQGCLSLCTGLARGRPAARSPLTLCVHSFGQLRPLRGHCLGRGLGGNTPFAHS